MDWTVIIQVAITLAALGFGVYQYVKRRKDKVQDVNLELQAKKKFEMKQQKMEAGSEKSRYCHALKNELGKLDLLGSPDIKSKTVSLEDAFVSLCISESWHCDDRFMPGKKALEMETGRFLTPEQVMIRAFREYKLLVIIGDPGSGKTTLLKYYAMNCLDEIKSGKLGFPGAVLPVYFPLRELEFDNNNEPVLFPDNLARWSERFLLNITGERFLRWLQEEKTLVLLDGLDEISSKERRQNVCRWIESMCSGLENARFVVTSRATGYRKLDGIELEVPHLRADIMDFSPQQQEMFLKKWFRAVYLSQLPPVETGTLEKARKQNQEKIADRKSQTIIEFLKQEDNKAVRELAAVPMLLQIMAIIWKDHQHLPESRSELYDAALKYLLDYRDRRRKIKPLLRAEKALMVLAPLGLWMQEKLIKDEVSKVQLYKFIQPILNKLSERPAAPVFCENLRDRAGLIVDYDKNHYIFRHKSFREFLAGVQLVKEALHPGRMETLITYFNEDWWEETFRFFMSKSDDEMFNQFMQALFQAPVSQHLDDNKQNLLRNMVIEAPQKKIDALVQCLNSEGLNSNQRRYVMDCLKTIGTPEALEAIASADKTKMEETSRAYAEDIIAESRTKAVPAVEIAAPKDLDKLASFRNPFEDNVEYIKIPEGTYNYSVTKEKVTVPGLYFCKYPVTNKRYRKFINFLGGREKELERQLSFNMFAERLFAFAKTIDEYAEYLGKNPDKWQDKLRSRFDDEKKFNGEDQPVVAVTWYAARAYCFWLSCLEAAVKGDNRLEDISRLAEIYRLPDEKEWEWAAGGNPDGSVRPYPWRQDRGEPNPNLANYNQNVGATTPVGRYPQGATPHGLMDMAGNVWEWMENLYSENEPWPSFRGGSWFNDVSALRCSARCGYDPVVRLSGGGFRVVRAQS
ncbi:MAG: SUMF1/EgtB/PvdO family nonheme iron enzyme [Candidatus Aminicenantes bacterium]|nr:MAG: SUMF1/EgtB/PvdO family nonheme iron enzyme [Candidatus Aminicenantes bacterium]